MQSEPAKLLSVQDIQAVVAEVGSRTGLVGAAVMGRSGGIGIRYLRLKPGRGLIVLLGRRTPRGADHQPLATVLVGEDHLAGARLRFTLKDLRRVGLESPRPGIVHAPELALSVQIFPADTRLPDLIKCFDTRSEGPVLSSLLTVASTQLGDGGIWPASAQAHALRYKAGSRCVIVYRLRGADQRGFSIIGKIYADRARARFVHRTLERLYDQFGSDGPFIPRPLGIVEPLGLTLAAAVETNEPPGKPSDRPPRSAGSVLARLHGARLRLEEGRTRDGSLEALLVRQRARRLAAWQPALAARLTRLGDQLACRLERADPDEFVVAHGGYKRSQLIPRSEGVYVVDFDGTCLADPALDVGCFLAYLRPSRMLCGRTDYDQWFGVAGAEFVAAYRQTAIASGGRWDGVKGILERARLYEASHLLKIANRRLNRLNSPRPLELSRICGEIAGCLDNPGRWS